MSEIRIPSQLRSMGESEPADADKLFEMAKTAWYKNHVLHVSLDNPNVILSQMDRSYLEAIGIKLFGKREQK
ncbi:MAG: hypothetical protein KGL39_49285 [Patescibacteria group bacterium]|nr:hypothetical protein [Patescibacteria group bacterium]